ncbi:MAG: 1-deoxy-D-xylulose-5-phosphate reductoisomerase [Proteobacteria bacterium]|jgi:1-deoxy-D-xylulose-5-phosphate reductoisomerase|nr:1-deoxy-D-xylulose-5-phosphate reductoisomerase [Pseudomonadota bacterium]
MKKYITVLGSTGSIGCSTLAVVKLNLDKYQIFALTANTQADKLFEQCVVFKPRYAVILDKTKAKFLQDKLLNHDINTQVLSDTTDLTVVVEDPEVDIVMSAIVGSCGLLPTYSAIKANKKVLLSNKESLIAGGQLMINALKNSSATLIPVDSEHNAIFQCLEGNKTSNAFNEVSKIILTASGGPFRTMSYEDIAKVTVESALQHPNWSMGKKVTIDSSTLMNKGLEVIEAYWLFGQDLNLIDVVVHPQSIIHSMVEYVDGSVLAQLGMPDMKTPIAHALAYPNRINSGSAKLDFTKIKSLTFESPDYKRFPCLQLAFDAIISGGTMPAILNAANEVAVAAFLNKEINFYAISDTIDTAMNYFSKTDFSSIDEIIDIDSVVRDFTLNTIRKSV